MLNFRGVLPIIYSPTSTPSLPTLISWSHPSVSSEFKATHFQASLTALFKGVSYGFLVGVQWHGFKFIGFQVRKAKSTYNVCNIICIYIYIWIYIYTIIIYIYISRLLWNLASVRTMFFLKDLKPQKKSYGNVGPKLKTYIFWDDLYIPREPKWPMFWKIWPVRWKINPAKRRSSKNHSLDPWIVRGLKCFLKQGSVLVLKIAFCLRDLRILWEKTPRNHHENWEVARYDGYLEDPKYLGMIYMLFLSSLKILIITSLLSCCVSLEWQGNIQTLHG